MKIAYLSQSSLPSKAANSVHVMKMAQAFAAHGHELTLVAPSHTPDAEPRVSDLFSWYGVSPSFAIRKLSFRHQRLAQLLARARLFSLAPALLRLTPIARDLQRSAPDFAFGRDVVACFIAARLGIATGCEIHKPLALHSPAGKAALQAMFALPSFRGLVVISEALRQILIGEGLPAERILVAHDAADPAEDLAQSARDTGALTAAYVGSLLPGRGVELIIDCAKALPNMQFLIIGGNPNEVAALQAQATTNVTFTGHVSPAQATTLRKTCDILLAPYQRKVSVAGSSGMDTSAWMSPLKLFEYMASGKPILCSDLPVLREVMNERNCVLLAPDDPQAWAAAIHQLQADPQRRVALGQAALVDFSAHYTWKSRATLILSRLQATLAL